MFEDSEALRKAVQREHMIYSYERIAAKSGVPKSKLFRFALGRADVTLSEAHEIAKACGYKLVLRPTTIH